MRGRYRGKKYVVEEWIGRGDGRIKDREMERRKNGEEIHVWRDERFEQKGK